MSLALHGVLFLLCAFLLAKRPEPGGSGLVMDVFLVRGGDGFYQTGVPWGDPDYVPGTKGTVVPESQEISPQAAPEEKANAPAGKKSETAKRAVSATKSRRKKEPVSRKTPAVRKKSADTDGGWVKDKTLPLPASMRGKGGGGTGTQPYGGAVGDAPGYGAGRGTGIGIGTGSGIGDIRMARYFVRLRRLFQRRLMYPETAEGRKRSGKAIVRFHMEADGRIVPESIRLTETSGHAELDEQALKTVRSIPKLPEPPDGSMTIDIPIVFRVYH